MENHAGRRDLDWTAIYQTQSPSDADLVRTTLEVAGYRVWVQGGLSPGVFPPGIDSSSALTVSVPAVDSDDARDYLKQRTSLLPNDPPSARSVDESAASWESLEDVAEEIWSWPRTRRCRVQIPRDSHARHRRNGA